MDSDEGKLFVGGLGWDIKEDKLRSYFTHYGEVTHAIIMRDRVTGLSRGFAFVVFSDPSVIDIILQEKHTIDGRPVEAKRALPRAQHQSWRSRLPHASEDTRLEGNIKTRKIFVGGLPSSLTEEEFCKYFQNYGNVTDKVIMFDPNTGRPRGFGFITFDSEDAADKVLHKNFHELKNKLVEVKRALPKEANPAGNGRVGGYPGYGSYDPIRVPESAFCGYTPYNSYGALNYGYGYDPYTCYSGAAGVYMNPSLAGIVYASSLPGVTRTQWSSQNFGYGDFCNLNASYGASSSFGASSTRATIMASTSTSQGHASQNNNQGNGCSIHTKNEGPFTDSDGNETGDRHKGSAPNSSSGEATNQAGQHEANGCNTATVFDSNNGSPGFPDAA
ncbi:heterogeneous nuclear ribonucleoprotein 1-like [Solanum dulcamara]|uniref:heterogeneous nuclear ribonucleoprotein 1-like n=1 Tax=Solanum dulcamara TaxID=45834 RepID=UPI002486C52D|nr:heterogeneous nuclear ribonucleoprotein 1-like [Solanum dulcamara]XP_055811789.1 heterogeneous nuclear ribonucleoprotein 1-like [Solanum dulcamara]